MSRIEADRLLPVTKPGLLRLLKRIDRIKFPSQVRQFRLIFRQFLQAEDVSSWPEHLKKKMERGEVAREEEEMEV